MKHDATVDIIIATRGRGALIEPAIRSVLASARGDFTLWIVDQSCFHRLEPERRDERPESAPIIILEENMWLGARAIVLRGE